jgi:type II secretory pathway pseudopilin PulG
MKNTLMAGKQPKPLNENGFASIVIALILIIVLALLTVGFAQLARREQQDALDKQLASQAYDAAESGVNNAYHDIENSIITQSGGPGQTKADSSTCMNPVTGLAANSNIDATHGVSYSCLLVDLTPPTLEKGLSAGSGWSTAFKVVDASNNDTALKSFDVVWGSSDGHTSLPPSTTQFPPVGTNPSQWGNSPALLEVSVTPLGAVDRNSLIDNSLTAYFKPSSTAGSLTYPATAVQTPTNPYSGDASGAGGQGQVIQAKCTSGKCTVTVNMSSGIGGQTGEQYLIHVADYYDDSQVGITNAVDTNGKAAYFANSQAVIDVTGKARQVLKRIQANVPLRPSPSLPSYGIEAEDLCKRFNTTIDTLPDGSPGGTNPDTSALTDPEGDPNGACSFN